MVTNEFFLTDSFSYQILGFRHGFRFEWMFLIEWENFWSFEHLMTTRNYFVITIKGFEKDNHCIRKISWKSTWTFFGPQRSIFVQFMDTRARFTSQGSHSIIRSQSKVRLVSENHLNRRPQSYRPRERTYFWVLRGTLWTKIGLKPVLEVRITTSFQRIARGMFW